MSRQVIHWVSGAVQTSGAVAATICSWDASSAAANPDGTATNGAVIHVEAFILVRDSVSLDSGSKVLSRAFTRNAGTLAVLDAAIITVVNGLLQTTIVTETFDIDASTNTIRLRASGVATRTIDHFGDMRIRIYQP
jgi:hypothetical protein